MGLFRRIRRGLTKVAKGVVRNVVPGGSAIVTGLELASTSRRLLSARGSRPKTASTRTAGGISPGLIQPGGGLVSSPFQASKPAVLSATSGTTLTQQLAPMTPMQPGTRQQASAPPSQQPRFFGPGGVISSSPVDFGPVQFDPGALLGMFGGGMASKPTKAPGGMPAMQGGQQNLGSLLMAGLMQKMMAKGSGDRALLEAIFSGNVQRFGPMFPTPTTNTPRGPQNISPKGYVTMYFGDQAVSVLRPIAECFGYKTYKPKSDLTKLRRKLTGAASAKRKVKALAKKAGYSVKNTKSGI